MASGTAELVAVAVVVDGYGCFEVSASEYTEGSGGAPVVLGSLQIAKSKAVTCDLSGLKVLQSCLGQMGQP